MKKIERYSLVQVAKMNYADANGLICLAMDVKQLEREREELRTALLKIRANIRNISTDPEGDDNYNIAVDILNRT